MQEDWGLILKARISSLICPIHRFGRNARVHSVFENSFNIEGGGQLINVTNFPEYLSSFGISLPDDIFQQIFPYVQQGNIVKIRENQFTFYSHKGVVTLSLEDADIVTLNISTITLENQKLQPLQDILKSKRLELLIGLEMNDQAKYIFSLMTSSKISIEQWQEVITYLIGRGKGLTPSGDDIITTYLSVLRVRGDSRAEVLSSVLAHSPLATTDISKAYILGAIQGYVNSFVFQLFSDLATEQIQAQIQKSVDKLMYIGHSSGKDMCFGLLLGLQ